MAANKFMYARAALVAYLRASASLVSLTGHTAADPRIAGGTTDDTLPQNCLMIFSRPARPLIDVELDDGPWNTSFHVYIQHTSEETVYQILGTLQEYVARNTTTLADASYSGHANVQLESIRWSADLSNAPEVQKNAAGLFWTDAFLVARWREK